jgi:hypothetical protein
MEACRASPTQQWERNELRVSDNSKRAVGNGLRAVPVREVDVDRHSRNGAESVPYRKTRTELSDGLNEFRSTFQAQSKR